MCWTRVLLALLVVAVVGDHTVQLGKSVLFRLSVEVEGRLDVTLPVYKVGGAPLSLWECCDGPLRCNRRVSGTQGSSCVSGHLFLCKTLH